MLNELSKYEFLTEKEVSALLRISVSKLQKERGKGVGIPFVVFGKCIRYRQSAVTDFINSNTYQSTSQISAEVQNENRKI